MRTDPVDAVSEVVVRDVVMRHEPRALVRPARAQAPGAIRSAVHAPPRSILQSMAHAVPEVEPAPSQDKARLEAVEQGRKDGHAEGYREGLKRAEEAAGRQLREAIEAAVDQAQKPLQEQARSMAALLDTLGRQVSDRVDAAQDEIALLAFDVACRVLGAHAVSREGVTAQLQRALDEWRGKQDLTIRLHPDDAALLQDDEALRQVLGDARPGQHIELQADAAVALGGCVLHSVEGGLDARLETQMDAFKVMLQQARATQRAAASRSATGAARSQENGP